MTRAPLQRGLLSPLPYLPWLSAVLLHAKPLLFCSSIWCAEHLWDQSGLRCCGCCALKLGWHPDPALPRVLPRNVVGLCQPPL